MAEFRERLLLFLVLLLLLPSMWREVREGRGDPFGRDRRFLTFLTVFVLVLGPPLLLPPRVFLALIEAALNSTVGLLVLVAPVALYGVLRFGTLTPATARVLERVMGPVDTLERVVFWCLLAAGVLRLLYVAFW